MRISVLPVLGGGLIFSVAEAAVVNSGGGIVDSVGDRLVLGSACTVWYYTAVSVYIPANRSSPIRSDSLLLLIHTHKSSTSYPLSLR